MFTYEELENIVDNTEPILFYNVFRSACNVSSFYKDYNIGFFDRDDIINILNIVGGCIENVDKFEYAFKRYISISRKRQRIKKFIGKLLEKDCLFLTLTFDEEHINMVDKRRKIVRFLGSLNCNYIGNVDYGADNGRIHYHVIVQCDHIDFSKYKYGAINGKIIVNKDINALKKYIVKLTNHAVKDSVGKERILKCDKYV